MSPTEELTPRSLCRCTPSPRPRTFPPPRASAPYGYCCPLVAPPLCSTFSCCQADYICDTGFIFGLLDMAGCCILRPRERNIVYGSSLGKTWCSLAGNQLSVAPAYRLWILIYVLNSFHGICLFVVVDYSFVRVSPEFGFPHIYEAATSPFLQNIDRCQCCNHRCPCTSLMCVCLIV